MNYIDKLRADIQQLKEQIEVIRKKITHAISKGTPHDLNMLLLDIDCLNTILVNKQKYLIQALSRENQSLECLIACMR